MNRIDNILEHECFKSCISELEQLERDRRFCRHGLDHGLDVARICYIINLEEKLLIKKDVLYAMALLHDLGRVMEYRQQDGHHVAGARLAEGILSDCGYQEDEIRDICDAISNHKSHEGVHNPNILAELLYRADKLSRDCFVCQARAECYWNEEIKNRSVLY